MEVDGLIDIDHVIHLENLAEELPPLARKYGLLEASISALSASHHNTRRCESARFAGDLVFRRTEADTYPDYRAFYNEALAEKIRQVYAEDFRRYGYGPAP